MKKIFTLMILFLIIGCGKTDKAEEEKIVSAKLSFLSGKASVIRNGIPQEARLNMKILPDDIIKTGKRSEVNIIFRNIGICKIKRNSQVLIKDLAEASGINRIRMDISSGKIVSMLKKMKKKQSSYEIHTPTAVAGVRGTTFIVAVASTGSTKIGVVNGEVDVRSIDRPEEIIIIPELKEIVISKPEVKIEELKPVKIKKETFIEIKSIYEIKKEEKKDIEEFGLKEINESNKKGGNIMFKRSFLVVLFMFLFCFTALAEYIDVVHLKDGSIIKGVIIEQIPGKSIKIETKGGSVFVYRFTDVVKISKEKDAAAAKPAAAGGIGSLTPQQSIAYTAGKKNGTVGFALSCLLVPGAGHWYCGEIGRGFLFLGVDAALVVGMFTLGIDYEDYYYTDWFTGQSYYAGSTAELNAFFYIALGLATVSRVLEWIDVFGAAKRYNEKLRQELGIPANVYLSFNVKQDRYNNLSPIFGLNYAF